MNFQTSSKQLSNQLWLNKLIVVLLLVSQFMVLQHSTEHVFHHQNDYCLSFQTANASPSLLATLPPFEIPERQFDTRYYHQAYSIIVPFIQHFSPRAPPFFS